jgi:hypothetical protein
LVESALTSQITESLRSAVLLIESKVTNGGILLLLMVEFGQQHVTLIAYLRP